MGDGWVQDPDGGWHQKRERSYGRLVVLLLVLIFVGGYVLWVNADMNASRREGEREAREWFCRRFNDC